MDLLNARCGHGVRHYGPRESGAMLPEPFPRMGLVAGSQQAGSECKLRHPPRATTGIAAASGRAPVWRRPVECRPRFAGSARSGCRRSADIRSARTVHRTERLLLDAPVQRAQATPGSLAVATPDMTHGDRLVSHPLPRRRDRSARQVVRLDRRTPGRLASDPPHHWRARHYSAAGAPVDPSDPRICSE
jgi:hypothetical protein